MESSRSVRGRAACKVGGIESIRSSLGSAIVGSLSLLLELVEESLLMR